MAQEKTDRRTPEQKDYRARPSVSGSKSPQTADKKKTLQSELDDLNFDFEAVGDERNPETEDTKLSLKLMIDELTDEAVENRTSPQISSREELIPLHKVEMIDDDDPDEEPRLSWLLVIAAVIMKLCGIAYPPLTLVFWYFYIWFLYGWLIIRRHICAAHPDSKSL
jgi:hypothetical protein